MACVSYLDIRWKAFLGLNSKNTEITILVKTGKRRQKTPV